MPVSTPLQPEGASGPGPLCVRLEALLRTDLVLEAALAHVRRRPSSLAQVLFWRLRGRAALDERLAAACALDVSTLPFHEAPLARVQEAKAQGRTVMLAATGALGLTARVAAHLGATVVTGPASSGTAVDAEVVGAPASVPIARRAKAALRALRPHQWVKNALVFLPPLLAHAVSSSLWLQALFAFVAFSLCASSVYVLNDLLDLHADRAHARKRNRPFASGELPLGFGLAAAPLLLASSVGLAYWVSPAFLGVLGAYYAVTFAYSLVLKRVALLDVLVLAGLYTVRIIAGGVATGVTVSEWLLGFSLFLFTSLAFVKRYSEVHALRRAGRDEAHGRGYRSSDLELLQSLGPAAGYMGVLVLALYVSSEDVTKLYTHPERLWALVPLMLYWVSRVWLLAHRGQMHDDPIVFAIRDRQSYAVALFAAACVWVAI